MYSSAALPTRVPKSALSAHAIGGLAFLEIKTTGRYAGLLSACTDLLFFERKHHETSPQAISTTSGRGRRCATGRLPHGKGAILSDASDPTRDPLPPGWSLRRRRAPLGG